MGSSNSHLGSRPHRPPRPKRTVLSLLLCGASSPSSTSQFQMEDNPAELLVNSAQYCSPVLDKLQRPEKASPLASDTESRSSRFSRPKFDNAISSGTGIEATADSSFRDRSSGVEASNHDKDASQSREKIPVLSSGCRSRDIASTSYEDQSASGPISINRRANLDLASSINNKRDKDESQISSRVSNIRSLHEFESSFSDGLSIENHASEVTSVRDSGYASIISDSPVNFDLLRLDNLQEETPSGLEFVSDRELGQRDESILHLDVPSTSASIFSGNTDVGNREARHNSRRLFWDAFSRRNSRRHRDSLAFVFANDESDELGSHDRWLVDFNGDVFDDGFRGDTGFLGNSTHSIHERRWHSRAEIWERLHGGQDGSARRTNICPSGLHPNSTCTCDSIFMDEESSARASISRIVMLAEALFEVLDEIHRQPVSLSLSMVSLPAPESIVDSLPVKSHNKTPKNGDEDDQCYICLAEYEEGDKIRVLPCHHEYHLLCVDKWLKEMHGVCPLCRGDVREGSSLSNPELNSLS